MHPHESRLYVASFKVWQTFLSAVTNKVGQTFLSALLTADRNVCATFSLTASDTQSAV